MSLSQSQLRLLSAIGMGVLVGTSLVVIIPEGIEAVYESSIPVHSHGARGFNHHRRTITEPTFVEGASALTGPVIPEPEVFELVPRTDINAEAAAAIKALPGPVVPESFPDTPDLENFPKITDDNTATVGAAAAANSEAAGFKATPGATNENATGNDDDEVRSPPTFFVGFSLVTGFILMYLIDKLPQHFASTLQETLPRHISLNNLSDDSSPTTESFLHSLTPSPKQSRSLATTTGLVIHAAADGIAMGASASSSNTKLGFIVFLAIMVHKAPAAFGLTSVLLKQGLSKRAARSHLIIFSVAAPFGALSTWLLVNIMGGSNGMDAEGGQWWTGMLLLFSAGTFLYVAMHAMQDDASQHDHSTMNGFGDGGQGGVVRGKGSKSSIRDTVACVVGMLIPLVTQIGHHH